MLDFPNSPALNQIFTSGNLLWTWDGTKWLPASSGATAYVAKSGDTMTGNLIVNPGSVGIGTAAPGDRLEVASPNHVGDAGFVAQLGLTDTSPNAIGNGGWINFRGVYTGTSTTDFAAIAARKVSNVAGEYHADLSFYARQNGTGTWTPGAPQMVIQGQTGNVGIGTTVPNHQLTIRSNNNNLQLDTPTANQSATMRWYDGGVARWGLFTTADANHDLQWYSNGAGAATVTFQSGGNVGIGTATPGEKLDVVGNIKTSGRLYAGDAIWLGQTTSQTVPGTNSISAYSATGATGIWSIGTTTAGSSVGCYDKAAGSYGAYLFSNTAYAGFATIANNGSFVRQELAFYGTGGVTLGSPTGGSKGVGTLNATSVYANNVLLTSDAELKTDIKSFAALPVVAAIEPKTFRWLSLPDVEGPDGEMRSPNPLGFTERLNRGFLAQDVVKIIGGKVEDGVDIGSMIAILWQAVRELSASLPVVEK